MSVVHNYPEFKQPLDVLNRYEALGEYIYFFVVIIIIIINITYRLIPAEAKIT